MIYKLYKKLKNKRREYFYEKTLSKHGLYQTNAIKTWTTKEELQILYIHALNLEPGSQALEIGSYLGASTCYIVAALAEIDGHITCVDTWNNETMPDGEHDTFSEFQRNTQAIQHRITIVRKNTYELSPDDFTVRFDYVFIDGDHSYAAVKNDFCLVLKLINNGSIVFFHDAKFFEGVTRVIGEALASGEWTIGGSVNNLFWIIKK